MLLAIDVGNTTINLGIFTGSQLVRKYIISTEVKSYYHCIKKIIGKKKIDDVIICSVVPDATKILKKDLKRLFGKQPYIIGRDIKVPIKNLYRRPKQVGQDRLVNAYAGIMFYKIPLIAVDFGTAVTFDIISKKKEYLGGIIIPGLKISLEALNQKTALLPKLKLERPKEFIGRDTKNSMLSGLFYGFAALTDVLTKKIKNKIGKHAKVIGTGGYINLISKFCKSIDKIDKDLTLKGINLLYEYRQS